MSKKELRPQQRHAIDAFFAGIDEGYARQVIVLPTGMGKTFTFAQLTAEFLAAHPDKRVLVVAHTDELLSQARGEYLESTPHLRVGTVKATKNQVRAQVVVASVATLRSVARMRQIRDVGLVIIDECHRAAAASYVKVLEHYGCMSGQTPALGVTATLVRSDKKSLGDVWEQVAYSMDISTAIRLGYLVEPRGKRVEVSDLDLSGVRRSGGDLDRGDLGRALSASMAPELVARAYAEHASSRQGILFAPTVESAGLFCDQLNAQGIKTELVHGGMGDDPRGEAIKRFKAGTTQVLANCMLLTEGFDAPRMSCVVIARPTRSAGLYQQMVGRALRVDSDRPYAEQDALILDITGASRVHGLASLIDLSEKRISDGAPYEMGLIEAEDRAPREAWEDYAGPVDIVDFDPLAASRMAWMRTEAGAYFLSVGTKTGAVYVFLIPSSDGNYAVAWCTKDAADSVDGRRGDMTEHRGMSIDAALSAGEIVSRQLVPSASAHALTSSKDAPWRKKRASEGQIAFCRSLGIEVRDGMRSGEASALIDTRMASRRIDPIVSWFQRREA